MLCERCDANAERLRSSVENSIGLITALNPYIGYEKATALAVEAHRTGRAWRERVLERRCCRRPPVSAILAPEVLTKPIIVSGS